MAAIELIADIAIPFIKSIKAELPIDVVYIAPFAREVGGDNAIPQVLADACGLITDCEVDLNIVQKTRVYHTGADPMERLALRPEFDGPVVAGKHYVLVDDVINLGVTLAELADYIQYHGGTVAGTIVLVNVGRNEQLIPDKSLLAKLRLRYEHEIRNRLAKAKKETNLRLRSKGIERKD